MVEWRTEHGYHRNIKKGADFLHRMDNSLEGPAGHLRRHCIGSKQRKKRRFSTGLPQIDGQNLLFDCGPCKLCYLRRDGEQLRQAEDGF
mgnify:CR=1 FL=1